MNLFRDTWRYLIEGAELDRHRRLPRPPLRAAAADRHRPRPRHWLIGLPIALWLGHLGKGGFLAINISNVGRAVPTFALLALLVAADWPGSGTLRSRTDAPAWPR